MRTYEDLKNHPNIATDSVWFPQEKNHVLTPDECWEALNDFWVIYRDVTEEGEILLMHINNFRQAGYGPNAREYDLFVQAPETELKVKALWMLENLGRDDEIEALERAKRRAV